MSNAASYSRVGLYEKCPASYEWQYVLGHKQAFNPGPAATRGLEIHQSIEDHFNSDTPLHEDIPDKVAVWILEHKNKACLSNPEFEFAFTKDWETCEFDATEAYIRGYMDNMFVYKDDEDVTFKVVIHEYKTGQIYDDHVDQKQLYAMAALIIYPELDEVEVTGIYIDQKKQFSTRYSRLHLHSMQYTWQRRIDKMHLPLYPARPGMHCRWCPKSSKWKEGSCQVG